MGTFAASILLDKTGKEVTDEAMLSNARCLMVLEACARFLEQTERAIAKGAEPEQADLITMRLGLNVIEISTANAAQLRSDAQRLAARLGVSMTCTPLGQSKGVH